MAHKQRDRAFDEVDAAAVALQAVEERYASVLTEYERTQLTEAITRLVDLAVNLFPDVEESKG